MPNKIPTEDLIDEILRLSDELGRTPTVKDMESSGSYSKSPYEREFGSWNNAIIESGLPPIRFTDYTRQDLIDDIQRVADEVSTSPSVYDIDSRGKYCLNSYRREFGSWNDALRTSGLDVNNRKNISEDELLDNLHRVREKLGRPPRKGDLSEVGEFSVGPYRRVFGSWGQALISAGMRPHDGMRGENHHNWKGGTKNYSGKNWDVKRKECRERDDYVCQNCGVEEEDYMDDCGRELEVHHLIPRRKFDEVENSNSLDNLVLLCSSCHIRAEFGKISV